MTELKTETIKINDRDIVITELSFASQMKLEKLSTISSEDIYKECISKEDFEYMSKINREDGKKIVTIVNKLNKWDKTEENKEVFLEPTLKESGK